MLDYKGDFINGTWHPVADPEGTIERENPSRRAEIVFRAPWTTRHVDEAIKAARAAQPSWDRLGVQARTALLERLAGVFTERVEELAAQIALEAGKPLWEARGEAKALAAKVGIMTTEGAAYTMTHSPDGVNGRTVHRPLGVLAVLGPFNFPMHLPNGHIIPALLTGNCVVVKPSELTPGCMQLYFECLEQAGFPPGVINLVQGPGEVGAALSAHRRIDGVLFTGSYETGLRIKRATIEHHWKLLALEMGGKNTSIVCDDADIAQAAHEIAQAAFLTCGQRCTATSRVIVHEEVFDAFAEQLIDLARRVTTGDASDVDQPAFMGPLINERSYETFLEAQKDDEGGKLEPLLEGGPARDDLDGYFVSPAIWRAVEVDAEGSHQSREIFGPDVILYAARDDQHAAEIANATEFGLAMSIFTASRDRFDVLAPALEAGIVNWNRSTAGASSKLPFGGIKRSGNHRPAAITAGLYCTYPQAQLLEEPGFDDDVSAQAPFTYLSQS